MWLVTKDKILTKVNLQKKGWSGDVSCQFCNCPEDVNHLFFHCFFAKHVWFHMGQCQQHFLSWHSMEDVIQFALTLPKHKRQAFLIVISAVTWGIWKHRNDLCFNNSLVHSCRNVILTIISLIVYWTGKAPMQVKVETNNWMPQDIDEIPVQVIHPAVQQLMEWISDESE